MPSKALTQLEKEEKEDLAEVVFNPEELADDTARKFFMKLRSLSERHQLYVLSYLKTFNKRKSVLMAGYSNKDPSRFAWILGFNQDVQAAIDLGMEVRRARLLKLVDETHIIESLVEIADDAMIGDTKYTKDGDSYQVKDRHAAIAALKLLGQYLDMFTETVPTESGQSLASQRFVLMQRINGFTAPKKKRKPSKKPSSRKRNKASAKK